MSVDDSLMCSFQILKSSKKKKWFLLYQNTILLAGYKEMGWPKDKIIGRIIEDIMLMYHWGQLQ